MGGQPVADFRAPDAAPSPRCSASVEWMPANGNLAAYSPRRSYRQVPLAVLQYTINQPIDAEGQNVWNWPTAAQKDVRSDVGNWGKTGLVMLAPSFAANDPNETSKLPQRSCWAISTLCSIAFGEATHLGRSCRLSPFAPRIILARSQLALLCFQFRL